MPHRPCLSIALLGLLIAPACGKDQLEGPKAEVTVSEKKLQPPAVPAFDLPAAAGDGSHSVKELRVKGRKFLETEVTVQGYVTWVYECKTALREPGMTDEDVQKLIEAEPDRCERPKFYIGDAADTPAEKSLWVVDVPRPYNKAEMKVRKKGDPVEPYRCDPAQLAKTPLLSPCPPYKVGDKVTLTGTFSVASPHSERNTDGLVVFKKMKNETAGYESPPPVELPPGTPPPATKISPNDMVKPS
jgi:hypothetical protein